MAETTRDMHRSQWGRTISLEIYGWLHFYLAISAEQPKKICTPRKRDDVNFMGFCIWYSHVSLWCRSANFNSLTKEEHGRIYKVTPGAYKEIRRLQENVRHLQGPLLFKVIVWTFQIFQRTLRDIGARSIRGTINTNRICCFFSEDKRTMTPNTQRVYVGLHEQTAQQFSNSKHPSTPTPSKKFNTPTPQQEVY